MKIGDKVRITATGLVGIIIGKTATSWKIDFAGFDKPELVLKTEPMELVEGVVNPNPKPNVRPIAKVNWNIAIIAAAVIVLGILAVILF